MALKIRMPVAGKGGKRKAKAKAEGKPQMGTDFYKQKPAAKRRKKHKIQKRKAESGNKNRP